MNRPPIIEELRNDPALCVVAAGCLALIGAWAVLIVKVLL